MITHSTDRWNSPYALFSILQSQLLAMQIRSCAKTIDDHSIQNAKKHNEAASLQLYRTCQLQPGGIYRNMTNLNIFSIKQLDNLIAVPLPVGLFVTAHVKNPTKEETFSMDIA